MTSTRIKPEDIRTGGTWEGFEVTDTYRRSRMWMDEKSYIVKTEYLADDELITENQRRSHDSKGRRLGDYTHVGSIPLNVLYSPDFQIAEKLKEDDKDYMKWFLNSDKGAPFKTWWGKL